MVLLFFFINALKITGAIGVKLGQHLLEPEDATSIYFRVETEELKGILFDSALPMV